MGGIPSQVVAIDSQELRVLASAGSLATRLGITEIAKMKVLDPPVAQCFGQRSFAEAPPPRNRDRANVDQQSNTRLLDSRQHVLQGRSLIADRVQPFRHSGINPLPSANVNRYAPSVPTHGVKASDP